MGAVIGFAVGFVVGISAMMIVLVVLSDMSGRKGRYGENVSGLAGNWHGRDGRTDSVMI